MPIPPPEWREQFIAEHGYPPSDWDIQLREKMPEIQSAWQQRHGFTPINWKSLTQAYGYEGMRAQSPPGVGAESRPFSWGNVDLPYTLPHIWRPGGGGGGGGGGWTAEQLAPYRQNFLSALQAGQFYGPQQFAGFGPQGWWMRPDYTPEAQSTAGSWLWQMPEAYREAYMGGTPEIQQAVAGNLWPEYQRRGRYQGWPGTTRMMR